MNNMESSKGEIVMYQPDETIRLEVRMGEETVWLTQQQMAELFDKDRTVIGRHIRNIYKEEELEKSITCAKFAHMGTDGDQEYEYTAYNLDVIISVGYRVKSKRGTKFRQWANGILKEYLLRGYVVNARIMALEQHVAEQDIQIIDLKNKVDFFVRSSLPPVEGIFYDGQIFDAYVQIAGLIKQAKHSIVLVDNYIDETTLTMLSKRDANVSVTIYKLPEDLEVKRIIPIFANANQIIIFSRQISQTPNNNHPRSRNGEDVLSRSKLPINRPLLLGQSRRRGQRKHL